ncbi:MAG: MFS transporter [bacterium]|nr:MFS transporter [bacterium]
MASTPTIAARLDRLPPSAYIRRLVVLISLGGCFEFYDLFIIAYIALGLIKAGVFKATTSGLFDWTGYASFVAASFAGLFVGTILFAYVSDRYGRRSIFAFSLLWYSVFTFIMAFQNTAQSIDFWRFIASVGIGVELVNIDTYISEISPKESRGRSIAFSQIITFITVPIVALIATLLVPHTIAGLAGWRWVVIIGSLGAIAIWFIRLGLPESPRWLANHDHAEEADRVMTTFEQHVQAELDQPLPPPTLVAGEQQQVQGSWFEMWSPQYRSRTIMLIIFNFFQTVGYYGFASWVPVLLFSHGVTLVKSLEYTFVIAVANPFGPWICYSIADKTQRKWQIVGAAIAIAVFGLIWAQMTAAAGIIIFGILITLANNILSPAFHAYQAELYPTRIRAQAVGFVYSWSRFSTIFVGFLIAAVLRHAGVPGVFTVIAGAMAIVAIVIGSMGPVTSRVRLEALSQ